MGKKPKPDKSNAKKPVAAPVIHSGRPSALLDTRVVYCGDNLETLSKPALSLSNGLPDACVDLTGGVYIDPPCNSNRNYEVFWGETRAPPTRSFEDRHASTQAYPGAPGRPRCVQVARVLNKTGSFYYYCDWHTC